MISERAIKIKQWCASRKDDLYIAILIFLVGMGSFALGRLSAVWPKKEPITITTNHESRIKNDGGATMSKTATTSQNSKFNIQNPKGKYVASKNGTAYHFPWCQGALKIKEENKIWFHTKEEAQKAGYKPAGNCEGL